MADIINNIVDGIQNNMFAKIHKFAVLENNCVINIIINPQDHLQHVEKGKSDKSFKSIFLPNLLSLLYLRLSID